MTTEPLPSTVHQGHITDKELVVFRVKMVHIAMFGEPDSQEVKNANASIFWTDQEIVRRFCEKNK